MSEIYRQFEDWWSKYKSPFTEDDGLKEFAWVIWQASREAMDAYEENIRAAGIKVKE